MRTDVSPAALVTFVVVMGGACVGLLSLLSLGPACADPCLLPLGGGGGCNVNSDCSEGKCRLFRTGEAGLCLLVRGKCERDATCGSVDDCAEGECCNPETNRCQNASSYSAEKCDERSCRDCDSVGPCNDDRDCPNGFVCGDDETCEPPPECENDDDCPTNERCDQNKCRRVCFENDDCPNALCFGSTCSEPYGSTCRDSTDCNGLTCQDLDAQGNPHDGYCSEGFCDEDFAPCPPGNGFVCVNDECRLP